MCYDPIVTYTESSPPVLVAPLVGVNILAKSITEWSVKDGYTYTGESMPDDCLADDTTTDSTDSGDSPDRTTAASGGTLSESDGAQALVAGALAPLAALLL